MKKLLFGLMLVSFSSCDAQSCNDLPRQFNSYKIAVKNIKSTDFIIEESVDTSKSSVIRNASFYSCDSKTGFLLIKIRRTEYIYQNVPISVWESFKTSESFGSYYNKHIKKRYILNIIK